MIRVSECTKIATSLLSVDSVEISGKCLGKKSIQNKSYNNC